MRSLVALASMVALSTFATAACDIRPDSPDEGVGVATSAAGPGYKNPNTFDGAGNLAVVGGVYNTQAIGTPMELWMGVGNETAGTLVGHVTFLTAPERVRIDLRDVDGLPGPDMYPYVATDIHIHFAATVADIPHARNGNPIPGQFEYNIPVTDPHQSVFEIPVAFDAVGAIHLAVYRPGGIEGFNFYLPDNQVTLRIVDYPSAGDPSYFRMQVTNGGFISTYDMGYGPGVYEAWCIDNDHTIGLGTDYAGYLYSSYDPLPSWLVGPGLIEYPENFDKVNYLINHFESGQLVQPVEVDCAPRLDPATGLPSAPEALTYSDLQRAIWSYMDDNQSTSGLINWSQWRVNALLCETNAGGEGFVPGCAQKVVFLVVPAGTFNIQVVIGQPVIGEVVVSCTSSGGTAWGDGKFGAQFPGAKQWGTYFLTQP